MTNRVERVQGLRSSGAAGSHGHEPTRAELLAAALADYDLEHSPAARYGNGHCPFEDCSCGTASDEPCDEFQADSDGLADLPWCMCCNWAEHAHGDDQDGR